MAVAYYGSHISEHLVKTPEGYLICYDVPINRTGTQMYTAGELGLEGEPERPVTVYRLEEDVFSPAALASLEGKDITRGHPAEMLAAENQASYSKGHLEHVRRDGDNTVADLIIKDPGLASDVESGVLREVSCGYYCRFEPYLDGYRQTNLVGNHVAVVPRGRAGHSVAIKDHAAGKAEKGLKRMKKETKEALYRFFGLAANDAAPERAGAGGRAGAPARAPPSARRGRAHPALCGTPRPAPQKSPWTYTFSPVQYHLHIGRRCPGARPAPPCSSAPASGCGTPARPPPFAAPAFSPCPPLCLTLCPKL